MWPCHKMGNCISSSNVSKVVVLGYPNVGKTAVLQQLTGFKPEAQDIQPYALLRYKNFLFFEVCGEPEQRARWIHQCRAACGILYVAEADRLDEQLVELRQLLQLENLKRCGVFIAVMRGAAKVPATKELLGIDHECTIGRFRVVEGKVRGEFEKLRTWIGRQQ